MKTIKRSVVVKVWKMKRVEPGRHNGFLEW